MNRVGLAVCTAVMLVAGCTGQTPTPEPNPDPVTEGFDSLRDFAAIANEVGWDCDESAADEQATDQRLDDVGYATMTCGANGRLSIWVTDARRQELHNQAPFALTPPYCTTHANNWSAGGTSEMITALTDRLHVTDVGCAIE